MPPPHKVVRATAVENRAPWGITVNAVCPGLVATSRAIPDPNPDLDVEETLRERSRRIPVGRVGRPQDVAAAVAYLASPDAATSRAKRRAAVAAALAALRLPAAPRTNADDLALTP